MIMTISNKLLCKEELEPELALQLGQWAELVQFDGSQDPIDFDVVLMDGKYLNREYLISDDLIDRVLGLGKTIGIFDLSYTHAQLLMETLGIGPIEPGYFVTISRRSNASFSYRTFR